MHNEQEIAPRRASAAGIVAPARKPTSPPVVTTTPIAAPKRASAAGLAVPKTKLAAPPAPAPCEPLPTEAERRALYDRLRALRDLIGPVTNQNELATELIVACISGGICTKPAIVSALVHLGLFHRYAGKMVDVGAHLPARWRKGADGRYSLLS